MECGRKFEQGQADLTGGLNILCRSAMEQRLPEEGAGGHPDTCIPASSLDSPGGPQQQGKPLL